MYVLVCTVSLYRDLYIYMRPVLWVCLEVCTYMGPV